jgi:putative transposase
MRYRRLHIEGACYFFTVVTAARRSLFEDANAVGLYQSALDFVRLRHPFVVEAQVILPDHIHAIWQLPEGDANYPTRWRLIKSNFTHRYLKEVPPPPISNSRKAKNEQGLWQRRYWEHLIEDEADFISHLDYVHYNPVYHGLVDAPRDWQRSTFHDWVARGVYEPEWGTSEVPGLEEWAGRELMSLPTLIHPFPT